MSFRLQHAGLGIALTVLLAAPARADVPYEGPLTFWGSGRAPSGVSLVIAGIAISAALVAAGLLITRSGRFRTETGFWVLHGAVAFGVIAIAVLFAEIGREARLSRNRTWNPPPMPQGPVGDELWKATGQFPDRHWLERKEDGRELVISHPYGPEWPRLTIGSTDVPDKEQWGLSLQIVHRRESFVSPESSLYEFAGKYFDLVNGDVIPIYDQLYEAQVRKKEQRIILSRVTEKVAEEFRPATRSQTYNLAERNPQLYWERVPPFDDLFDTDLIALSIDKATKKATVKLTPTEVNRTVGSAAAAYRTPRKPLTLQVSKGDLLTARGRSYKVLNVVPPQQIKLDGIISGNGFGNLVGWIEISAEPMKAEAEAGAGERPSDK